MARVMCRSHACSSDDRSAAIADPPNADFFNSAADSVERADCASIEPTTTQRGHDTNACRAPTTQFATLAPEGAADS